MTDTDSQATEPGPPKTPRALGFSMPAEWERQDALWLAWPHDEETFPGCLQQVEQTYLQIIAAVQDAQEVHLLVRDDALSQSVSRQLAKESIHPPRVHLHVHPYRDVWFRDFGPIFVVNRSAGKLAMVHWGFNAWGGKYDTHLCDGEIPRIMETLLGIRRFAPGLVLEGGSIDVNGEGVLLTTAQCLLRSNRNPGRSQREIEGVLRDYLGVERFVWLHGGIAGDDTDGHIDTVARFVSPRTILCAFEEDRADENHEPLRENYERLLKAGNREPAPFEIVKLPMPGRLDGPGGRLPATYANFFIGTGAVLVPAYDDPNDTVAAALLKRFFPERRVVSIDCRALVRGFGTLHCITQQQPAVCRRPMGS